MSAWFLDSELSTCLNYSINLYIRSISNNEKDHIEKRIKIQS